MRALLTDGHGADFVETEPRALADGDVLVELRAATVNPADVMWAGGALHNRAIVPAGTRIGLGWDAVGIVAAVGADAGGFAVGDAVAGTIDNFGSAIGALAEQVVIPAGDLARLPDGLAPEAAATIGMNALTADQALDHLGAADGRSLLVTGAAGALGGLVLELAVARGWQVTGLARVGDADFVQNRGGRLITEISGSYDAIIDAAPLQEAALSALAPGGAIVGVLGFVPLPEAPDRTVYTQSVHPDGARLGELLQLAADGKLTPRVQGTVPFERAQEALEETAKPGRRGRWVVVR